MMAMMVKFLGYLTPRRRTVSSSSVVIILYICLLMVFQFDNDDRRGRRHITTTTTPSLSSPSSSYFSSFSSSLFVSSAEITVTDSNKVRNAVVDSFYMRSPEETFNINLKLSPKSKFFEKPTHYEGEGKTDDKIDLLVIEKDKGKEKRPFQYDLACYLIDGEACDCRVSIPWSVSGLTIKSSCLHERSSSYFSILLADSSRMRESLIITAPHYIGAARETVKRRSTRAHTICRDKISIVLTMPQLSDLEGLEVMMYSLTNKPLFSASVESMTIIAPSEVIRDLNAYIRNDLLPHKLPYPIHLISDADVLGVPVEILEGWRSLGVDAEARVGVGFDFDSASYTTALHIMAGGVVNSELYICLSIGTVLLQDFSLSDIVVDGKSIHHHNEARAFEHPRAKDFAKALTGVSLIENFEILYGARELFSPVVYSKYASSIVSKFAMRDYEWIETAAAVMNDNTNKNNDLNTSGGGAAADLSTPAASVAYDEEFFRALYNNGLGHRRRQTATPSNATRRPSPIDNSYNIKLNSNHNRLVRLFKWLTFLDDDGVDVDVDGHSDWTTFDYYSLVLDHLELFEHVFLSMTTRRRDSMASLLCGAVWTNDQLPWRPLEAALLHKQAFSNSLCLFSTVGPSVVGVGVNDVMAELLRYQTKMNMNKVMTIIGSGEFERIEGWCSKEKAIKISSIIKPTDVVVELGVYGGKSLLPMCLMTSKAVVGIDAWSAKSSLFGSHDDEDNHFWSKIAYDRIYGYAQRLMSRYNCSNVSLYRMKSTDAVGMFADDSIDVLHQDSNHSEEVSTSEVELYWRKVKVGGAWIFDDTNWGTTKQAQALLLLRGYIQVNDFGTYKIYKRVEKL